MAGEAAMMFAALTQGTTAMNYYLIGLFPASKRPVPDLYVMRDGLINALGVKPTQPGQLPFILTDAERIQVAAQFLALS